MKKKGSIFVAFFIFIFMIFLFGTTSNAGSQEINDLNYDVSLNEDGTVDVVETWNINVSDTNTLFKTFDLDSTKYGMITDVEVSDITSERQEFFNTEMYAYHVEKGGFYALNTDSNTFEIAWGVSIDSSETRKYEIKYKIVDGIKNYNDCSEFYWQFIGVTNAIPVKSLKGTIHLPYAVSNRENLKVWAHGPLNGNIQIVDNETVAFDVNKLPTETMVEVRVVVVDENMFLANFNVVNTNKLQNILSEEARWADEANRLREEALEKAKIIKIIIVIAIIIELIVAIFIVRVAMKYAKILKSIKKIEPDTKYQYFRDFPDEDATPAEAAFLYYFDKSQLFNTKLPDIVSGTILNLALKKVISFKEVEKNKINIVLNMDNNVKLKKDEQDIFNLLVKVNNEKKKEEPRNEISMKEIEKYAKKHDKIFLETIEGLENTAKISEEKKGNCSREQLKKAEEWSNKAIGYYVIAIVCICFVVLAILGIAFLICGIYCSKIVKKVRTLTQKGENEKEKWQGLERYMKEFSLLSEREVPELVLWEKYLVYATAFGVADEVLEQLKVKYPQIVDENYMINNGYTYMYMMNRMSINSMIGSGINKAYMTGLNERAARNYSSGSGRRRRLLSRRPVAGGGGGRNGRKIKV